MLNETYRAMLNNKSVIRETFMYGRQRAAQIGSENVFDYSLGNPSVPCPPEFTEAMQTLLAQEEPVSLHGYCPSQGDPGFRTAVAAHLTETFGLPYAQKHIFPTTGAAGAIAHAIRAVTQPGDEVLTFAPYFPEYGPYVAGTGAVLRVVPPQAPTFQPNLDAFAQMLTEKVTCVLINTPNNPTGVVYSANTFLNTRTLFIIVLGLIAFSFGTAAGVLCGKVMYALTGGQVNPLIGSAGVSAVPMAARVSQKVGQSENPSNFLLMHAMGPNVAGVIGSAVAAGILINIFG